MGWIVWDKGQRICGSDAELAFNSFDCALRVFTFNRVELMLDGAYHPSTGAHSGAGLTSPALPVAQARGKSGKDLITAFVAGSEVMYRIGIAAHDSIEKAVEDYCWGV